MNLCFKIECEIIRCLNLNLNLFFEIEHAWVDDDEWIYYIINLNYLVCFRILLKQNVLKKEFKC